MFVELPVEKWRRYLSTQNKKVTQLVDYQLVASLKAEREGFEPPVPLSTTVFKTVVIDHSTISPWSIRHKKYSCFVFDGAKLRIIYGLCKFSWYFFEIKSKFDEQAISKEYDEMSICNVL